MKQPRLFPGSPADAAPSSRGRRAAVWLKIGGAVLLLGGLLSLSKFSAALVHLRHADPALVLAAVLGLLLQVAVATLRWHGAARMFAPPARLLDFLRFAYVAQFFNQTLPASVGGDAARAWLHHTRGATLRAALLGTVADRVLGLSSLFLVAGGALLGFHERFDALPLRGVTLSICALGVAGSAGLFAAGLLPAAWFARWPVTRFLADLSNGLRRLLLRPGTGAMVLASSLLVHALSVIAVWLLARSVGLHADLPLLTVAVPVSLLAATIPISVGGWGLREGTLVAILAACGADVSLALAVSLLFGLSLFAVGIVGALGWIGLSWTKVPDVLPDALRTDPALRPPDSSPPADLRMNPDDLTASPLSPRKYRIRQLSERLAGARETWRRRASAFHAEDERYLRFVVRPQSRVLELGCGTGDLLAAMRPRQGTGIDFSPAMVAEAGSRHPALGFQCHDIETAGWEGPAGGPFDYVLMIDTIGSLDDVQATLERLHAVCARDTRVVIGYYAHFWEPLLRLLERVGLKMPTEQQNVLSSDDVVSLLHLAGFETVARDWRQLVPARLLGLGTLVNRFVGTLPLVRRLCLRHYVIARSLRCDPEVPRSATVIIPCRNERGNIEPAIARMPQFAPDIEVVFVEGHSQDGTYEEMERVQRAYPHWDIKVMRQPGRGKADAVYAGFAIARGDLLLILDADLTVPPEQLGKFWQAVVSGQGEYIQGTRLVYPMEDDAMRFLNLIANWTFARLFSWLLNQRLTDTLCGTKVMRRGDYLRLRADHGYFGDFDPFGDFDLIFGSAKLGLRFVEIPIRYASRAYGETQISRFRHGWMLLKMVAFAYRKIKAF